jgi:YD repeat-containing protein
MFKRALSRAALLALLIAPASSPANVTASLGSEPPSSQEQAKARVERMIEGAQKNATYDHNGRAVTTTVPTSDGDKVTVSLKYDERNRLQYVLCNDGTRIGFVYDDSGRWQGYSFPDGGKMLFERDGSGAIVRLRRVAKSAGQRVVGAPRVVVRRVAFGAPLFLDGCKDAVAAAAAAAAVAAATCLAGPSVECATLLAAAAVAAKIAYDACAGGEGIAIET